MSAYKLGIIDDVTYHRIAGDEISTTIKISGTMLWLIVIAGILYILSHSPVLVKAFS